LEGILAIDHGQITGYCYFVNGRIVDKGYFELEHTANKGKRLKDFYDAVIKLVRKYNPEILAIEEPKDRTNGKTAEVLIGYYSILNYMGYLCDLKVVPIHPMTMKKKVTGKGNAEKLVVADALSNMFEIPLEELEVPIYSKRNKKLLLRYIYDVSDALGLAYVAHLMEQGK
jgi:Holliday junction resolvasome RuvABC endonuclease subunit